MLYLFSCESETWFLLRIFDSESPRGRWPGQDVREIRLRTSENSLVYSDWLDCGVLAIGGQKANLASVEPARFSEATSREVTFDR